MAYPTDKSTYNSAPPPGATSRQIEAWALMETARRMMNAMDSGEKEAIEQALRLNWRMWTLIQADLLDAECRLPDDLRSNLLSLAAYIDRQTVSLLVRADKDEVNSLIQINRNLAMGLYAEPAQQAEPVTPAAPAAFNFSA